MSAAKGVLAGAGTTLVALGGINAALALTVETCTQGSADSLAAVVITLPLYLVGFALLTLRPSRSLLVALAPIAFVAAWHSWFALRLGIGHWSSGLSACEAMFGLSAGAGWEADGREPWFIAGWSAASILFWASYAALWRLASRPAVAP
ncbi:MAG TPA: hypothetical protein VGC46_05095 [Allosphingosinicella sp.]